MDTLRLLATALGLAGLAGINLYLTVFATGLAINQQWIILGSQYESLAVLGHPAVIIISGTLYFLQFFADKVPWVDSIWDAVHTIIRPVGGAFLAVRVLGNTNPVFDVVIALLAGGIALTTHGVKAGTRLVANTSPEPFSNIALSVTEDATVLGGLALIHFSPILSLVVLAFALASIFYFAPKIIRAVKVRIFLAWRKLTAPAADKTDAELSTALPADCDILFHRLNLLGEKIEWAAPCISTTSRQIPANLSGYLIATFEETQKLYFVAHNGWGKIAETLDLEDYKASQESKFLTENLVLYSIARKPKFTFLFDRTKSDLVGKITASIQRRLATPAPGADTAEPLPKLQTVG
jgi:hypothetical protein